MKLTTENILQLPIDKKDRRLLLSLNCDLEEISHMTGKCFYIDWQDYHDEYSPERTDPCPDYYGMYRIKTKDDTIGTEMTLDELDNNICILFEFADYSFKNQ